jgi:hypothetical protein
MASARSSTPPAPATAPWLTRRKAVIASVVLFAVSCALPALVVYNTRSRETVSMSGHYLLSNGWAGPLWYIWGWFANPLLLWSLPLLAKGRYRGAFRVGVAAVLVGLTTFAWYATSTPAYGGGSRSSSFELCYPTIGFFCWMGSLVVIPACASLLARKEAAAKAAAIAST